MSDSFRGGRSTLNRQVRQEMRIRLASTVGRKNSGRPEKADSGVFEILQSRLLCGCKQVRASCDGAVTPHGQAAKLTQSRASKVGSMQLDLLLAVIVRFSQDGSGGSGQLFQLMGAIASPQANLEKFSTGEGVRRSIGQGLQISQR